MRKITLLFLILPFVASAQVFDDFSDGDFTSSPEWRGTDTSFIVNSNKQLQSAATSAGESWLAVGIGSALQHLVVTPAGSYAVLQGTPYATEWRFWLRENFSPSINNYADVWLCADTTAFPLATRGYFLRFGSAGNQDAIELYRKDPEGAHLICKGADAAIASSFKVAVKVKRDEEGQWSLATDYDNVGNYVVEAEGADNTYPIEGCFGLHLHFTSSNAKKFYFDDVYIGPETIDTEAPELLALEVHDGQHLLLTFSESLAETALDLQHYRLSCNGEGGVTVTIPIDSIGFSGAPSQVLLAFNEPLPENSNLTLQLIGITDLSGNTMAETTCGFSIFQPSENDIVINEIFADPTPVVGLPEWEWVELFNTTAFTIDLKDWSFLIGTTEKSFPSIQIEPQGYLILCKTDAEPELSVFGPTCGFPSFAIANAGATLRLQSPNETMVSEVSFNDNWYHDADKRNGGWSLEQIDPFNPCAGTLNWSASNDPLGGTPGRVNSIDSPNTTPPQVARVSMLGDNMVMLWFDQQMDRESLKDPAQYLVEELQINPTEVVCNPVENSSLEVVFDYHFEEGVVYTLTLNGMTSCSGQPIAPDTRVKFGIPNEINPGDILINEILFDPITPCVDYVELYQHSDKTFDLSELKLGVIREDFPNPTDTVLKEITSDSRLFLPDNYLLLSTDGYTVCQQYDCETGDYLDMASFPSYANSGGQVLLMSRQGVVIDQAPFGEQMHYPLLKETKGVSLERISWESPSDQPDNWHSAAAAAHFGTPGYQNSMMSMEQFDLSENPVGVMPEVFSPDGDGFDDNCQVTYHLDSQGCTMNAYVFSADGHLVRHLVKGELVADQGSFVWNGLDSRGSRVPIGIYVVVTEVFDFEGVVRKYKNAVGVASR